MLNANVVNRLVIRNDEPSHYEYDVRWEDSEGKIIVFEVHDIRLAIELSESLNNCVQTIRVEFDGRTG